MCVVEDNGVCAEYLPCHRSYHCFLQMPYCAATDTSVLSLKLGCVFALLPCICLLCVTFKGEYLLWLAGATTLGNICDSSRWCVNDVLLHVLVWDNSH